MSNCLHDEISVGQQVRLAAPYGVFTLDPSSYNGRPAVFIAGGIGVTPVLPMAKALVAAHPDATVRFIQAVRTADARPFAAELNALAQSGSDVAVHCAVEDGSDPAAAAGRITPELLRGWLPDGQIKTDRLADIAGIEKSLEVRDSHLIYIARPDDPSQMVPAAVSVGDPYAADHVSVTVPGVGSTTRKSLSTMTEEAAELKREADRISAAVVKVGQTPETVAAIAYMGYQPPLTMTSPEMLNDGLAQAGAPKLNAFLGDLNAAAKPGHTTALYGHSYGSLMSGIALKEGAGSMVDNVVLYGSPGFAATSPAQLGLRNDQFFVMSTPDDFIANTIGGAAPLHGWGADPNTVVGGQYLFTHLETQAGTVSLGTDSMGRAIEWDKIAAHGHSEYGRNATGRMTGFNLAAILLDRPDLTVKAVPPALSDTRWGR